MKKPLKQYFTLNFRKKFCIVTLFKKMIPIVLKNYITKLFLKIVKAVNLSMTFSSVDNNYLYVYIYVTVFNDDSKILYSFAYIN